MSRQRTFLFATLVGLSMVPSPVEYAISVSVGGIVLALFGWGRMFVSLPFSWWTLWSPLLQLLDATYASMHAIAPTSFLVAPLAVIITFAGVGAGVVAPVSLMAWVVQRKVVPRLPKHRLPR